MFSRLKGFTRIRKKKEWFCVKHLKLNLFYFDFRGEMEVGRISEEELEVEEIFSKRKSKQLINNRHRFRT